MRFIMSCTDRKETEKRPEADNIKKPGDGSCVWLQIRRNDMAVRKEMVLYYTPEKSADDQKLKGVLVRLGIRIRNITPEQIQQKVGYLAGLPGFEEETEKEPEVRRDSRRHLRKKATALPGYRRKCWCFTGLGSGS